MSLTIITITGTFERPSGEPAEGTVVAQLTEPIENAGVTIEPTPILGQLNAEGKLKTPDGEPFTLAANDDTGTTPTGSKYVFTVRLDIAPIREFYATVPHAHASVDITELQPA